MNMNMDKIVAIHQPNFFPWLGYFNKISRADVFIILDNVQFPKTGGTWINRVQMMINGAPAWVTVPIRRAYHGTRLICDMEINNDIPWQGKFLKTIKSSYGRALHFNAVYPVLENLIGQHTDSLADFNIAVIKGLMEKLGFSVSKLLLGSSLAVDGSATQLLVNMTRMAGGATYLAGGGAGSYQDDGMFSRQGIELVYQNFRHPCYPQFNAQNFIPGLSVIDALMNCGFDETSRLIANADNPERQ